MGEILRMGLRLFRKALQLIVYLAAFVLCFYGAQMLLEPSTPARASGGSEGREGSEVEEPPRDTVVGNYRLHRGNLTMACVHVAMEKPGRYSVTARDMFVGERATYLRRELYNLNQGVGRGVVVEPVWYSACTSAVSLPEVGTCTVETDLGRGRTLRSTWNIYDRQLMIVYLSQCIYQGGEWTEPSATGTAGSTTSGRTERSSATRRGSGGDVWHGVAYPSCSNLLNDIQVGTFDTEQACLAASRARAGPRGCAECGLNCRRTAATGLLICERTVD